MQPILSALNLVTEDGRINLVNSTLYSVLTNLLVRPSTQSCVVFGIGALLFALQLYLSPRPAKKATQNDIEHLTQRVESVSKDLRGLNLKLGFRQ